MEIRHEQDNLVNFEVTASGGSLKTCLREDKDQLLIGRQQPCCDKVGFARLQVVSSTQRLNSTNMNP